MDDPPESGMSGVTGSLTGSPSDPGGRWVVGKVNVGGRGLTASCGPNPGPDVKISTETNGSGLVTAAAAAAFTSVLGMLSSSLLVVLVSAAAATRSLSLLPGVAMTSTAALTTGVTGSIKR